MAAELAPWADGREKESEQPTSKWTPSRALQGLSLPRKGLKKLLVKCSLIPRANKTIRNTVEAFFRSLIKK